MNPNGLDRALHTLEPYLGDLILCGAWAWYLYRRCLGPERWLPAEFTRDLDCIGRPRLPIRGIPLVKRLEAESFVAVEVVAVSERLIEYVHALGWRRQEN